MPETMTTITKTFIIPLLRKQTKAKLFRSYGGTVLKQNFVSGETEKGFHEALN